MIQEPLNILIVCEHASNKFHGEAMLPLNYYRLLSNTHHNVYLITHERARPALRSIEDLNQENIFYLPDTKAHIFLNKFSKFKLSSITTKPIMHVITQYYQYRIAKMVVKEKSIDIVHEPAPVSPIQPSALFNLNAPVIIGPMNGGMQFPEGFKHLAGHSEKLIYTLIRTFSTLYNLIIPGKRYAEKLLVANQRTAEALPKLVSKKVEILVENGTFDTLTAPNTIAPEGTVRVLYVGRLIDWKCVDIAIEAINKVKSDVVLTIVGDGPERTQLQNLAAKVAPNRIKFTGMIPHHEVNNYYDEADIFILPSVHECGGAVVLEAMSRGLAVIATNWGGPADYITSETGYLVTPSSRGYMIDEFSRIIEELASEPHLIQKFGQAAIERIRKNFLWDEKIQQILHHYQSAIETYN